MSIHRSLVLFSLPAGAVIEGVRNGAYMVRYRGQLVGVRPKALQIK